MNEEKYRETYRTEAFELLDDLEEALLELETQTGDPDLVNRIFRALHTIKGSGQMFGFDDIATFVHDLETFYDKVRSGLMQTNGEIVNLSLSSCDIIRGMLNGQIGNNGECAMITDRFQAILGKEPDESEQEFESRAENHFEENVSAIYRIVFAPSPGIFRTGNDPMRLLDELREMGECTVVCRNDRIPKLEELEPDSCYFQWDMILTTRRSKNDIRDVFIFVDDCELDITVITDAPDETDSEPHRLLGEILIESEDATDGELREALQGKPLSGRISAGENLVGESGVEAAVAEHRHVRNMRDEQSAASRTNSLRVSAEKLDVLIDLVGELVIAQARLSQHASTAEDVVAINIAEEVERLTTALRDNTLSLRMIPIGPTFCKFKRLVRDLSVELGKEVELVSEGGETELDKTVIDQLNDPLVHIIRNSIDHGIESPEERSALGKASMGRVKLAAEHVGAHVMIRITDDGAGLRLGRIRSRALEKGIIAPETELTDDETFQLVFEPGFSTASQVTAVSGRGVGMDVVKRGVEALRGDIDIQSEPGLGTTVTIKLPLTLAIIDGLLVETGGEMHVIPRTAVVECFEQTREDMQRAHGNNVIEVSEKMLPYICLRDRFNIQGDSPPLRQIIMCEANAGIIGIAVDRIVGKYQTVIKPLGDVYSHIQCFSGATILGDGTPALILDPAKLSPNR